MVRNKTRMQVENGAVPPGNRLDRTVKATRAHQVPIARRRE
jgi:hypothetical protein